MVFGTQWRVVSRREIVCKLGVLISSDACHKMHDTMHRMHRFILSRWLFGDICYLSTSGLSLEVPMKRNDCNMIFLRVCNISTNPASTLVASGTATSHNASPILDLKSQEPRISTKQRYAIPFLGKYCIQSAAFSMPGPLSFNISRLVLDLYLGPNPTPLRDASPTSRGTLKYFEDRHTLL